MNLEEITSLIGELSGWGLNGNMITKTFDFKSFPEAIDFVNKIAEIAEKHNHHPDITIRHTVVHLALTTHSAGGLTEKDFEVAKEIDLLTSGLKNL